MSCASLPRRRLLAGFAPIALLLLAVLPACEPPQDETVDAVWLGFSEEDVGEARHASFIAIRRYTDYVGTTAASHTERFVRQGELTRVDLLTLNGLARDEMGSTQEIEEFDRLAGLFAGGRGRYIASGRDFQVRDLDLFLANYDYLIYDDRAVVAGRQAIVLEVTPRRLDRPSYTVWIDAESLQTLKYLEFLSNGALAAEMEVESILYEVDPGESFPAAVHSGQTRLDLGQAASFANFDVLVPFYLPGGFVWQSTRVSTLAGNTVLAWSYSDGVQELFMVQYAELSGNSSAGTEPVRVGITAYGPAVDAECAVIGTQLHVTAKLDPEEVMTFIEGLDLDAP